ncbi:hypothetical protein F4859DRAFT_521808 [Xylaria cf. heliscus]|nr:hypothetical protein F4859DRAFT_521808 [Xylaria cf. heliscus]
MSNLKEEEVLTLVDSGGTTNPYSEGYVQRYLLQDALPSRSSVTVHGNDDADGASRQQYQAIQGSTASLQTRTPISGLLETQHQHLKNRIRLLIQPRDPATFRGHPDHQHQEEHTTCQEILRTGNNSTVHCIALKQGREDVKYAIMRPLRCELYYDPSADSITLINRERDFAIIINPIIDGIVRGEGIPFITNSDNDHRALPGEAVLIPPSNLYRFELGTWAVSRDSNSCSNPSPPEFLFEVYPRIYSLQILGTKNDLALLASVTGSKRKHADENATSVTMPLPHNSSFIRRVDDLGELQGGDLVRMAGHTQDGSEEYQIRHLGHAQNAKNSTIFQAKVTSYPKEHVVDAIVSLLGSDARLSALFLHYINAPDLAHRSWRSTPPFLNPYYFRGTPSDATRVLSDISRALEHLAEHNIIHHDIKPANILYRNDSESGRGGRAVLIDFGLGSQGNGQGDGKGEKRHNGGTPWYVAPEFLASASTTGDRNVTAPRSAAEDIWALGIVLLYLLRLIPLPESGIQGKAWQVKDAMSDPSSSAHREMMIWLRVIKGVVKGELGVRMRGEGDGRKEGDSRGREGDGVGDDSKEEEEGGEYTELNLYGIVGRMLTLNPVLRITPGEIRDVLKTLKEQNGE